MKNYHILQKDVVLFGSVVVSVFLFLSIYRTDLRIHFREGARESTSKGIFHQSLSMNTATKVVHMRLILFNVL